LSYLQISIAKIKFCKTNLIVNIVKLFENRCLELAIKSDSDLLNICHIELLIVNQQLRSVILATIFNNEYGDKLFNALCKANDIELDRIKL